MNTEVRKYIELALREQLSSVYKAERVIDLVFEASMEHNASGVRRSTFERAIELAITDRDILSARVKELEMLLPGADFKPFMTEEEAEEIFGKQP